MVMASMEPTKELVPSSMEPLEFHHVVQQSVTMVAYMDKSSRNHSHFSNVPEPAVIFGFSVHDLPILIGAAAGAVGLTIIILLAVIVWHCCRGTSSREKSYSVDSAEIGLQKRIQPTQVLNPPLPVTPVDQSLPSDMVVYVGLRPNNKIYDSQIIQETQNSSNIKRSQTFSFNKEDSPSVKGKSNKPRPTSQPFCLGVDSLAEASKELPTIQENLSKNKQVPQICASYSALDEPCNPNYVNDLDECMTLKAQSLPSWGKLRPLSTEDNLTDLYAKVSFSKKRKNRMGSESAAAIAVNKSSNCFKKASAIHAPKDTDSLVDNEIVVVYDERTAL